MTVSPGSGPGPHDAPTAAQLVEAVRELLEGDVLAATTGRVRYHVRVAVNVLAMVQRELELGPALAAAHADRLAGLGVASDAELAAAIRAGALDDREDEVVAAVRATVADKLAVANPTYGDEHLDERRATGGDDPAGPAAERTQGDEPG